MIYTNENWKPPVTYCEPNKVEVQRMNKEEAITLLEKLRTFHNGTYAKAIDMAIKALEELPKRRKEVKRWKRKALQQERLKGKWIHGNGHGECPFCGREKQLGWDNFCGFCGADMRGERSRTSMMNGGKK